MLQNTYHYLETDIAHGRDEMKIQLKKGEFRVRQRAKKVPYLIALIILLHCSSLSSLKPVIGDNQKISVPEDFSTIQEAINNADNGDIIYVRSGLYYEDIIIDKNLTLLGENKESTQIIGEGFWSVIEVISDDVTIKNFTISAREQATLSEGNGILIDGVDGVEISDCITHNGLSNGIYVYESNVKIINYTSYNNEDGIHIDFSHSSKIINAYCYNNTNAGIKIFKSNYIDLIDSKSYENLNGFWISDSKNITVSDSYAKDNYESGMTVINSKIYITSSSISHNYNNGIYIKDTEGVVVNTDIVNNQYNGMISIKSNVTLKYCKIEKNKNFGIENSNRSIENDLSVIDARECWWGSASGPYHPTLNPSGTGDVVDDDVEFDPWQTSLYHARALVIGVSGSGTTDPVPGTYTYDEDTPVQVDAIPDAGWVLSHWLLDGVDVGDADPYTVTMNDDYSLTAVFEEAPIEDVAPPVIMDVYQQPARDSVDPDVEVEVYATITDDLSGVRKAILNYTTNDEERFTVNMANLGGDLYMATIPQLPSGIYVAYIINAVDEAGNTVTEKEMGYQIAMKGVTSSSNIFILAGLGAITLITAILIIVVLRKTR